MLYPLSYGSGDGAKCGAKFAATPHVLFLQVTGERSEWKECGEIALVANAEGRLLAGQEVENTTSNGANTHYLHCAALVFKYQHCGHDGQKARPNI